VPTLKWPSVTEVKAQPDHGGSQHAHNDDTGQYLELFALVVRPRPGRKYQGQPLHGILRARAGGYTMVNWTLLSMIPALMA